MVSEVESLWFLTSPNKVWRAHVHMCSGTGKTAGLDIETRLRLAELVATTLLGWDGVDTVKVLVKGNSASGRTGWPRARTSTRKTCCAWPTTCAVSTLRSAAWRTPCRTSATVRRRMDHRGPMKYEEVGRENPQPPCHPRPPRPPAPASYATAATTLSSSPSCTNVQGTATDPWHEGT